MIPVDKWPTGSIEALGSSGSLATHVRLSGPTRPGFFIAWHPSVSCGWPATRSLNGAESVDLLHPHPVPGIACHPRCSRAMARRGCVSVLPFSITTACPACRQSGGSPATVQRSANRLLALRDVPDRTCRSRTLLRISERLCVQRLAFMESEDEIDTQTSGSGS